VVAIPHAEHRRFTTPSTLRSRARLLTFRRKIRTGYSEHLLLSASLAATIISGCAGAPGAESDAGEPPVLDACPAGGTLRITLWDIYVTPRRPDGMVWDGVSSGTIELFCAVGADYIRDRVRDAANSQLPGAGTLADQFVGDAFEETVAELCGVAGNWLQMNFEGPDVVAFGGYAEDTDWRWQTFEAPDTWLARSNVTTTGAPASWSIACDEPNRVGVLAVIDRDLVFDDDVGAIGLDLSSIPDAAICEGWGYYPGAAGIAGALVRLDVTGALPSCP
jgi:hypothetical protein